MSKIKCKGCGHDLKDTRAIGTQNPPAVQFVAHCVDPECLKRWEWVSVTPEILKLDLFRLLSA